MVANERPHPRRGQRRAHRRVESGLPGGLVSWGMVMLKQNYLGHRRDTGEAVDFPVTWQEANDAERVWRWDAEHSPFPLTPLAQEFTRGFGGPAIALES